MEIEKGPVLEAENPSRFLEIADRTTEEHWEKLVKLAIDIGKGALNTSVLTTAWSDESIPITIRDRAKLAIVGCESVRDALGIKTATRNSIPLSMMFGSWEGFSDTDNLSFSESPAFAAWLLEAFDWQQTHRIRLFHDATYVRHFSTVFAAGAIDEDQFHHVLDRVDLDATMPTTDNEGYEMNPNRFPLLCDLMFPLNLSITPKLKGWARDTFFTWVESRVDSTIIVPDWLDRVSDERGLGLAQRLKPSNRQSGQLWWPSWEQMRTAINYYGWEHFAPQQGFDPYKQKLRAEAILAIDDLPTKKGLVTHLLTTNQENESALFGDRAVLPRIKHTVDKIDDPDITELFIQEQEKTRNQLKEKARRDKEYAKLAEERRAQEEKDRQNSHEYLLQQFYARTLRELLESMRVKD